MMVLSKQQSIQEEEYFLPRHWNIKRNTRKGVVYYGYWEMALRMIDNLTNKDVLDVGCGDGYFTSLIAKKNPHTLRGLDYSDRAIAFARILEPNVEFVMGDMYELPLADGSVDIVYLIETLEHIPISRRPKAVQEIARVLRAGGVLVISVPSINMPLADKHEEHFSKESLQRALQEAFTPRKIVGQDYGGIRHTLFWAAFRLWKNRFYTIPPLVDFWTLRLYPKTMNTVPLSKARRFVGVFEKR